MYRSFFAGICLIALTACGSGVDQDDDTGGTGGGGGGGTVDPSAIPEALRGDLNSVTYNAAAGTLVLDMHALDSPQLNAVYNRTAVLDIGHYQAYTLQDDPLDRHFTALVAQSGDPDQSVRAGVVSDGGQFNRVFDGGFYERTGNYTPPPASALTGLVSYAGVYAGVTNVNAPGGQLLPVPGPAGTDLPAQSARTSGDIFLNVDFTNNVVNGDITNRVLVDYGTALPTIVLIAADIDSTTGVFAGATEYGDQTVTGSYGGIFGGANASAVGGVVHLDEFDGTGDPLGLENEIEQGVFVLIQCGLPGDAPICSNVNP